MREHERPQDRRARRITHQFELRPINTPEGIRLPLIPFNNCGGDDAAQSDLEVVTLRKRLTSVRECISISSTRDGIV